MSARSMATRRSGLSMARDRIFVPAAGGRGPYLLGIDAAGLVAQPFDLNTMSVTGAAIDRGRRGDRGVRVGERRPGHERPWQPPANDPDMVRPEGNVAWTGW